MVKGLWVAVPAYTGQVSVETAHSINVEMIKFFDSNHPFGVVFHARNSIISRCRNCLAMDFLASPKEFTDMLFLDSDVGFAPGSMMKLLNHPVDIVGGVYPYRQDPQRFPVKFFKGQPDKPDENGLVKVAGLPTGFMKISRNALETIMERFPDHWHHEHTVEQGKAFRFFDFVTINNVFYGEDFSFCALSREAGFDIYCDMDIDLKHIGEKTFYGNLKSFVSEKFGDSDDLFSPLKKLEASR